MHWIRIFFFIFLSCSISHNRPYITHSVWILFSINAINRIIEWIENEYESWFTINELKSFSVAECDWFWNDKQINNNNHDNQ